MQKLVEAKFSIGNIVKHKFLNFRGVIFDLDPEFNNTEEWYLFLKSNSWKRMLTKAAKREPRSKPRAPSHECRMPDTRGRW